MYNLSYTEESGRVLSLQRCLSILYLSVFLHSFIFGLFCFTLSLLTLLRHAVYDFHFFYNGYQTKRVSGMSYQSFINDLRLERMTTTYEAFL